MKAKIWNYHRWIRETEPEYLKPKYEDMLKEAGFKLLEFMEYHFKPYGYTAIWLLGESHFAVHTFPEEGKSYIELSSCNREDFYKFKRAEHSR